MAGPPLPLDHRTHKYLLRMERPILASEALADDFRVFVDEHGGGLQTEPMQAGYTRATLAFP
jgi:hypothetical protein